MPEPTIAAQPGGTPARNDLLTARTALQTHLTQCEPRSLARFIFDVRRDIVKYAIKNRVNPINFFFAVGDLIQLNNLAPPQGWISDQRYFLKLFEVAYDLNQRFRVLSEFEAGRYVACGPDFLFELAYTTPYRQAQNDAGLLSAERTKHLPDGNKYDFLHFGIAPDAHLNELDKARVLDSFWPISLQMQAAVSMDPYSSEKFRYAFDRVDMSVLARWAFLEVHNQRTLIPEPEFLASLRVHFDKQGDGTRSAEDFFEDYVSGSRLVPLFVRSPNGLMMDRITAFYFMILVHGARPRSTSSHVHGPVSNINEFRSQAGLKFEDYIREEFISRGFVGPNTAFKPRKNGLEYDIALRSDDRKLILLAEVKYKDMSPSTFSQAHIVDHELLSASGLLAEARRQQERLACFRADKDAFERAFGPKIVWSNYRVLSAVVTKHVPLISRYKETEVSSADQILDRFLFVDSPRRAA